MVPRRLPKLIKHYLFQTRVDRAEPLFCGLIFARACPLDATFQHLHCIWFFGNVCEIVTNGSIKYSSLSMHLLPGYRHHTAINPAVNGSIETSCCQYFYIRINM